MDKIGETTLEIDLSALEHNYTFSKKERLKQKKAIESLFNGGYSSAAFPLRIVWKSRTHICGSSPLLKVAFSVSKKRFPKAVDRNRAKRIMRECYRINKQVLYNNLKQNDIHLHALFIYTGKTILPFKILNKKMKKLLLKVSQSITAQ